MVDIELERGTRTESRADLATELVGPRGRNSSRTRDEREVCPDQCVHHGFIVARRLNVLMNARESERHGGGTSGTEREPRPDPRFDEYTPRRCGTEPQPGRHRPKAGRRPALCRERRPDDRSASHCDDRAGGLLHAILRRDTREGETSLGPRARVVGSRAKLAQERDSDQWSPFGSRIDVAVPRPRLRPSALTQTVGPND